MIAHISKNTNDKYIATSSTLETAKLHQGTTRVLKVDTEKLNFYSTAQFLSALDLIGLTPKAALEELLAARLDAQPDDRSHWHPCADYGDGEWVIYKGRRLWAQGVGNIPSTRGV